MIGIYSCIKQNLSGKVRILLTLEPYGDLVFTSKMAIIVRFLSEVFPTNC